MNGNLKKTVMDYIGYVAIAGVSVLYVLSALFVPGVTGKSIGEILVEGFLSYMLGVCLNYLFSVQGVMNGERDEQMLATRALHGQAVERISPFLGLLDAWCEQRNAAALRAARTRLLASVGLPYEHCFDENGCARNITVEITGTKAQRTALRERKRVLRRARRLHLAQLSAEVLTGESGHHAENPYHFGINTDVYLQRVNGRGAVTKLCSAVILGYFGVEPLVNGSYVELLWRGVYVALMLATGVITMYKAQLFMTTTHRQGVVQKINQLQIFENYAGEVEKNVGQLQSGSVQNRSGETAEKAAGRGEAAGECQSSETAQISAAKDGGAECGHDGKR